MAEKIEIVIKSIDFREIKPVPRVRKFFPVRKDGFCQKAEVSLQVTNGSVVTFHGAGYHIYDGQEATVDAIKRTLTLIPLPRNNKEVVVNFSEQAELLSVEKQGQIKRLICQG